MKQKNAEIYESFALEDQCEILVLETFDIITEGIFLNNFKITQTMKIVQLANKLKNNSAQWVTIAIWLTTDHIFGMSTIAMLVPELSMNIHRRITL